MFFTSTCWAGSWTPLPMELPFREWHRLQICHYRIRDANGIIHRGACFDLNIFASHCFDKIWLIWFNLLLFGLIWFDPIRFDLTSFDFVWFELLGFDFITFDLKWLHLIWLQSIEFDLLEWVLCNLIWLDQIWSDLIWFDLNWFDRIGHNWTWFNVIGFE